MVNSKICTLILFITIIGIIPYLVSSYAMNGYHGTEPFIVRIDSCLIAFSFVLIGYHLYDFNILKYIKTSISYFSNIGIAFFLSLLFGISFPFIFNNSHVNVYDACLGKSELLFYYLALLGSFYCIVIACLITKIKSYIGLYIKNIIVVLGKHSLFFYFGHGIIFQMYHKILIALFTKDWWPMASQSGICLKVFYFLSSILLLLLFLKIWNSILLILKRHTDKK